MAQYFQKLKAQTETRLWINNPTPEEMKLSIAAGAIHCTTNPTYSANMLQRDRDYTLGVIDSCLPHSSNDSAVADRVQEKLVQRIMTTFRPLYDQSGGTLGLVSIQGDPYAEVDARRIVDEARTYHQLGPNYLAKIPVTHAGLEAIETLLAEGVPVIATEIFAISQMIAACEVYRRATAKSGKRPAYFVTHITGIFDEYLKKEVVDPLRIAIAPAVLAQAGLAVARKQYRLFHERKYDGILLGGGARITDHFTGLVGGNMHITINWSTAAEILALNPAVENTIAKETPPQVIEELQQKLPGFAEAYAEDSLTIDEFEEYGPVQRFRRVFINGWDQILGAIAARRKVAGGAHA